MKVNFKSRRLWVAVGIVVSLVAGVANPEVVATVVTNLGCALMGGCDG